MENDSTINSLYPQQSATLPPLARSNVTEVYPSLTRLYQGLTISSVSTMVAAQTPTLAKIKNSASETDARALLYIALCEVCDFFNVGKNMSDTQIALTADLIIESYWYMKLEEIKFCFRRAMRREKLFDRLDGNIILGWLKEYDVERTEEAMRQSEQEALQIQYQQQPSPGAVSFEQYIDSLWNLAYYADPEAIEKLCNMPDLSTLPKVLSIEEQHRKEFEFQLFKQRYNQNKK